MRRVLELVLIVCAVAVAATPLPRGAVERVYARGLYPIIQPRLTGLSNATSMALLDVTLLVLVVAALVLWTVRLRTAPRGRLVRAAGSLALDTAAIGAVIYFWFLAAWGLNYQREPLRTQLDFREDRISQDALHRLALQDVESLNGLYAEANSAPWPELAGLPPALQPAFARAQHDLGMSWQAIPGRPKRSLLNPYFTRVSIDGMTDPFFLETLANQSLLPFERPFVVAHEWSHLAGYADEAEANFFAWLICMDAAPPARYSAWISLYGTIIAALPQRDRAAVVQVLEPRPRGDLRAMAERVSRQVNPAASRAGYAMYDRFLKANRVQAGIRSYNEVVRLLLGTRFTDAGAPVLREP